MILKKQIPNFITLLRLVICPIILLTILTAHKNGNIAANFVAIIMALIFFSDFVDGYLARKYNAISSLGALVDGLADKLIIYAILLFYLNKHDLNYFLIYFLLFRDFIIVSLKHYATEKNIKLDVVWSAKFKFFLECLLSFSLLYKFTNYSNILLIVVVLIAWYSAIRYFLNFLKKV
jgi:CDP-diacylglycerol--glycerol-3-phosphate 3-phosphatidyltransferase